MDGFTASLKHATPKRRCVAKARDAPLRIHRPPLAVTMAASYYARSPLQDPLIRMNPQAGATPSDCIDLLIIGGGINGAGIARDAAGRGHKVVLVEQADLASATSSASTKLIHGGLRYLELYE